ncbi:MAG: helix-turn-helix domain-containing protein [Ignavibacteriaceae bacterium]|nr:helix-turn-helix domain-containing protein [Ignavibacteriaceae bacterium]
MKIDTVTSIIAFITLLQLTLFSVFILTTRNRIRKSLQILSVFLLSNAIFILAFLLREFAADIGINPRPLTTFLLDSGFLFGPTLYWYSVTMTRKVQPGRTILFLHSIPFILYLFFVLIHRGITSSWIIPFSVFQYALSAMHIQILCYMVASIKEISNYQQKIANAYSSLEKMNLNWLKLNVIAFLCMWLVDIINFISGKFEFIPDEAELIMNLLSLLINFLFANLIIYKGLTTPELFIEPMESPAKNKYSGSLLLPEQSYQIAQKLKEFMDKEKPYLEPEITLQELSSKLDIQPRYLSQVINERLNKNFFEFINYYRIEEAKSQLASEEGIEKTVLEILYECGFNSKSVFNTFFKKATGLTPSQYRKRCSIAS